MSLWWKKMQTSGMVKVPARRRAESRLLVASDGRAYIGDCDPVRMTGFPRCENRNESAEAV
jgi:hypothetical protein